LDDSIIPAAGGGVLSKIASITIKGAASGSAIAGDHFGFVAQQIGKFRPGKTLIPLDSQSLPASFVLGSSADLAVRTLG
jgi:hypothetical protein